MKYAVEARMFGNGKVVAKVRPATPDDVEGCREARTCDIWVDLFETEMEAYRFAKQYRSC